VYHVGGAHPQREAMVVYDAGALVESYGNPAF